MSKVIALYHIVFCTKNRRMTIPLEQREHLYRFIWKECTDEFHSKLPRIGGIQMIMSCLGFMKKEGWNMIIEI